MNTILLGVSGDMQELSMFGRSITIGYVDGLTREDRTADGTLRRDIIAFKKIFTIDYELADESVVNRLEYLYSLGHVLTLSFTHLSTTVLYQVMISPISKKRELAVWGGLWSGVSFTLSEV